MQSSKVLDDNHVSGSAGQQQLVVSMVLGGKMMWGNSMGGRTVWAMGRGNDGAKDSDGSRWSDHGAAMVWCARCGDDVGQKGCRKAKTRMWEDKYAGRR